MQEVDERSDSSWPTSPGAAERERRTLLLFAATDFSIWKLYRRDLGKSREFATDRMLDRVIAAIRSFRRAS